VTLRVADLSVRFDGLVAVDHASIEVVGGRITGLIGPNGAGKTTLFNAVSGIVPAASGDIELGGRRLTEMPAHARARAGIRRTFQTVQLAQDLTVLENVAIGFDSELRNNWLEILFDWRHAGSADVRMQERVYETLEGLGLAELALQPVNALTFAQQRYVEIARALASRPKVLMLDEPAAGLAPAEIRALDALMVRLARETGLAILLVEHVIELVLKVCDWIFVLDNGRVIAGGPPASVARDPSVRAAYLGTEIDAAT
jgi:branched-chain amino acid transport system ATP-binding protein